MLVFLKSGHEKKKFSYYAKIDIKFYMNWCECSNGWVIYYLR